MEWAWTPGTLPNLHVLGSRQTHRQLATVVHDCNSSYLEAEAGVRGTQGYRVRLCLKTAKQPEAAPPRLTTATPPLHPQDSPRKQACDCYLTDFSLFNLFNNDSNRVLSPSLSNMRNKPFATEVAGCRAILNVCHHCCHCYLSVSLLKLSFYKAAHLSRPKMTPLIRTGSKGDKNCSQISVLCLPVHSV